MAIVTELNSSHDADGGRSSLQTLRVLHVVNGEHYSGAARVQDLLAKALPAFGVEVSFACVKPKIFPTMRESQETPLFLTPMRTGFDIRPAWRLARIIRNQEVDIVHAHTPRSILVGSVAAALTGKPLVYHVHSPTSRDSSRPLQNWVNDKVERICGRRASRLLAVSRSLKQHMESLGFRDELVRVAANGTPILDVPARTKPNGEWTIGTVALFRPRKGLEVLLDALATAKKRGLSVRLRAVGPFETSEYEAAIRRQATDLELDEVIDWVGLSRDIPAELQKMDLFVLPSLYGEGLPMVLLEAMSAATPVIATRVEGVPELVRHELDGLLVQPGNRTAIANAIQKFIEGGVSWNEVSESARQRHNDRFSDVAMASAVAAAYRELV